LGVIRRRSQRCYTSLRLGALVIGGHAVVLHGHLRNTFDLDLLIAESKLAPARASLTKLGYRTYFETDAFLQLQAPEDLPPLDLMIVEIEPSVMIAMMETVMQIAKLQPDFESRRLARKTAVKFRY
jgi:hypothetical protein